MNVMENAPGGAYIMVNGGPCIRMVSSLDQRSLGTRLMAAVSEPEGYSEVASLSELQRTERKRVTVEERVIVLFHVGGTVYAMDHFCYRE